MKKRNATRRRGKRRNIAIRRMEKMRKKEREKR
jgi:hypothetical protein